MKYEMLVQILDQIRNEAPESFKRYRPDWNDEEKVNQARSRAFIHLYLKVMFGITDFEDREHLITDGAYDGGVDGYYVDADVKVIYIIQSKFRTSRKNFEEKEVSLEELLLMEIDRIVRGEVHDEQGNDYNGKIRQFQRDISEVSDIARFSYRVVLLANLSKISESKVRQLTGGYSADVFDFKKTYDRLVFPVLSGTYFSARDIVIPVDLSKKNAGTKISYNVQTKYGTCEITALFVPTIEIAKIMDKYRNAILLHNPRSYLDLEGQSVNSAIRDTILNSETNEFALFNNGITMLSDETSINEKIGQKNRAQLSVKNPQIINGGQTSFTLSRIFRDAPQRAEEVFKEKEVLLKVITLLETKSQKEKVDLIDEISNATNKQSPVLGADRFSNEAFHIELQRRVFERNGLLYERKRGEFSDGVRDGYISRRQVIERNQFWRLLYVAGGKMERVFQKKLFQSNNFSDILPISDSLLDRQFAGIKILNILISKHGPYDPIGRDVFAKVYIYNRFFPHESFESGVESIGDRIDVVEKKWEEFLNYVSETAGPGRRMIVDKASGETKVRVNFPRYFANSAFFKDLKKFLLE